MRLGAGGRLVLLAALLLTSCAYYNAMWRAEQFAKQARRAEQRGHAAEARQLWAQATTKAESVLARHPSSRWADDALVLVGEGLAHSGDCPSAAEPLATARETLRDVTLKERVLLASAECALEEGDLHGATTLAEPVADSRDERRRARAAYVVGRAAAARGDRRGAVEWYARSPLVEAGVAQLRTLVRMGQADEALAGIPALARRPVAEADWVALIDDIAAAGGVVAASEAVTRLLAAAHLPTGESARLLIADGDRLGAVGELAGAGARYRAAVATAADSVERDVARARQLRVRAAGSLDARTLRELVEEAQALAGVAVGSRAVAEARATSRILELVAGPHQTIPVAFRAAEVARDTLLAPALATRIFLTIAADHPQSLFAPKAMVSALALDPPARDSIVRDLTTVYATSPYTRAFLGQPTPAYAVAEDSLAHALGVQLAAVRPVGVTRWAPPVVGPRGPPLDNEPRARRGDESPATPPQAAPPEPERARDGRLR